MSECKRSNGIRNGFLGASELFDCRISAFGGVEDDGPTIMMSCMPGWTKPVHIPAFPLGLEPPLTMAPILRVGAIGELRLHLPRQSAADTCL